MKIDKYIKIFILYESILFANYKNNKRKIKNNILNRSDLKVISESKKYESFIIANYNFNKEIPPEYINNLYNLILEQIDKNPKSKIFIKHDHFSKKISYRKFNNSYDKYTFLNEFIILEKIPKWGEWNIKDFVLKIYIYGKTISFVFSHVIFDGFTIFNDYFLKLIIMSKKYNMNIKIPKFRYKPILMEYNMINSYLNLNKLNNNNIKCESWRVRKQANNIICRIQKNKIKYIKNKLNISYNKTLLAILLFNIFKSLDKSIKSLNIAIVYAFDNNIGFNNYGGIIINIPRIDNFKKLCLKIDKIYNKNINKIYSSYFVSNVINTKKNFFEDKCDVVYSSIPGPNEDIYLYNDIKLVNSELKLPFSAAPIYIFCFSFNDLQECFICVNDKTINKNDLLNNFNKISEAEMGEEIL